MKANYIESSNIKILKIFLLISCLYGTTDYCIPEEFTKYYKSLYGSKYIFLTNICLYLTVICLLMGILVRHFSVRYIKNFYKNSVCVLLPLNGLVTILFWSLYTIDPTLIRDKDFYDRNVRINIFTDICVHLFPFISLLIETKDIIIQKQRYHLIFYVFFTFFYYMLCLYYSNLNNMWVYPLLGKLSTFNRVVLFGCSTLLAMGLYELTMYCLLK
ncbi:integral membrane [Vairimorpha ceranae]|uniref:Integral membrane n=1 Tax=Vairimorpha ceranae TaxID=40302 RepID=A0A0F9YVH0_9MICR|nr:integral membrane [Vairimorpha ceranae]KAF5140138.1 hypothetical protein G9O61_00g016920 [Vairimorpha ceranae]KKO76397.1 integral membrane [Vairimorpha ceranae]